LPRSNVGGSLATLEPPPPWARSQVSQTDFAGPGVPLVNRSVVALRRDLFGSITIEILEEARATFGDPAVADQEQAD
jgi:hypothetical protein